MAVGWATRRTLIRRDPVLRAFGAALSVAPVIALLAWVTGLGSFRTWFVFTGAPALVALIFLAAIAHRRGPIPLRLAFVAGTIGGLVGTIGYDLFRIPFVIAGLRLFAPIDSYGILLLGADSSSSLTGFVGWNFHFVNGVGFGIAYAMVALGRRWPWAVLWGAFLETVTIVTPFADSYGLRGHWDLIAIAYAAHLAYGIPLGLIVQRAARWNPTRPVLVPASVLLATTVLALMVWLRPGIVPSDVAAGRNVASGPSAIIEHGRLVPEWVRVEPRQCAVIENRDDVAYDLPAGRVAPAHGRGQLCLRGTGAHRVKLAGAYSGGFVLVDPEA